MLEYIKRNPLIFILIFLAIVAPQFVVGTLRFFLYAILGVILLIVIAGVLLRFRIERFKRNMQDGMGGYSDANSNAQGEREDIRIVVDPAKKEKKVSKNVGDYVDFEEVEE